MWWISGWSSGREGRDTEAWVQEAGAIFPGREIGEVAWRRWHQSGLKSEKGKRMGDGEAHSVGRNSSSKLWEVGD